MFAVAHKDGIQGMCSGDTGPPHHICSLLGALRGLAEEQRAPRPQTSFVDPRESGGRITTRGRRRECDSTARRANARPQSTAYPA